MIHIATALIKLNFGKREGLADMFNSRFLRDLLISVAGSLLGAWIWQMLTQ